MTDEETQDNSTPADAADSAAEDAPAAPAAADAPAAEQAKISSGYRLRIGLMSLMLIGWAAYCAYDGFYAFEKHDALVRHVTPELDDFKAKYGADRGQWIEQWNKQLAGKPIPPPDDPKEAAFLEGAKWPDPQEAEKLADKGEHTSFTYWFNYVMLVMSAPAGVLYLIGFLRAGGRWIRMDETGYTTNTGKTVPFAKVTKLNKERWRNKGIAVVHYDAGGGREGTLVLDDWKFEREPIERMLKAVQDRLSKDQIIGDKPPLAELVDPDGAEENGEAGEDEAAEADEDGDTSEKSE